MRTAEECRAALESLTARISGMDPDARSAHLADRTLSCHIPDLGITFVTRLAPDGAAPVRLAAPGEPAAQVRFTADSDVVVKVAADPSSFGRAWLRGQIRVAGSLLDLLRLRNLR